MIAPRLGLDTATPFLALALWWPDDNRIVRHAVRIDRALGALVVPAVASFLGDHGVRLDALGGIGVGVGPGAYTGARVGVAFASGLSRARGWRLVGGDTAAARALAVLTEGATGWVAVDARRGQARASRWVRTADSVHHLEALEARPWADLPEGARASLEVPPDAALHARLVNDPEAGPPLVRYA